MAHRFCPPRSRTRPSRLLRPSPWRSPPRRRPAEARRYVDLTLGAWRPREAAVQLATTLGIALGPGLPSDPATSPITIGRRGIDVGAVGDADRLPRP